jgi:ABC-type transport system involved in cytochrome bd biosynthesis fused ATPase/permease subunit
MTLTPNKKHWRRKIPLLVLIALALALLFVIAATAVSLGYFSSTFAAFLLSGMLIFVWAVIELRLKQKKAGRKSADSGSP